MTQCDKAWVAIEGINEGNGSQVIARQTESTEGVYVEIGLS